jgi:hypothetical protein
MKHHANANALLCLLPVILALGACGGKIETGCEPSGKVTPICGVQMPEDLVVLPDEGGLLISEYGDGGHLTGALTWYQPGPGAEFVRLVQNSNITTGATDANWGEQDCPVPDKLSPHGIHLSDWEGKQKLLVVNHASREQVLFYEVVLSADGNAPPELAWRGCVSFPDYAVLNDVAALPGGGFAVTHMYDKENTQIAQFKALLGLNKGHVWWWYPRSGARVVTGSEARLPNGIEVDPSGESVWVNNYIDGEVVEYEVASDNVLTVLPAANIDNSAWLGDGRLAVASHHSPLSMGHCFGLTEGSCGGGYDIIAVDPENPDQPETLYSHPGGGPFGPATVAVPYKGKLYAGSFSGDRMASIAIE